MIHHYRQISNISCTLRGNTIVDHSGVVGAQSLGTPPTNYIFMLDLTPGFNELDIENCKTRPETFKFYDLVWLILEVWQYMYLFTKHENWHYLHTRLFFITQAAWSVCILGHYSMWPMKSSPEDRPTKIAAQTVLVIGNINPLRRHHQDYKTSISLPAVAITGDLLHLMRLRQKLTENYGNKQLKPCFMVYDYTQTTNQWV